MARRHAAWVVVFALLMAVGLMAMGLTAAARQATAPQPNPGAERQLEAAIHREQVLGDVKGAIEQYKQLARSSTRAVAAQALVHLGQCYEKLGAEQAKEARATYERVVKEFGDQAEAAKAARARLTALSAAAGGSGGRADVAVRRVWVGKDGPAGISPDGRYVVLVVAGATGGYDYWLRDLQSGEQKQITREGSPRLSAPALISPDGRWIAYAYIVGLCGQLRVSALDGSSMRVVIPCEKGLGALRAWMPDSRSLLAVSINLTDKTFQRHIISVADGTIHALGQPVRDPELLTTSPYPDVGVFPSPDGRYVAYTAKGDIYTFEMATERDTALVQSPAADYVVGWTPDGSAVLFLSDRSGTHDLYLQGVENGQPRGNPQLLQPDFGANTDLYLTNDGRLFRIQYTLGTTSYVVPVDAQTGKLTGVPTPVDPNYPNVVSPGWSPDGKLLYYQVYRRPRESRSSLLSIRSEATGETRRLAPKPGLTDWCCPVLSRDGRRFVVTGAAEGGDFGVFAIDAERGGVSQLVKLPEFWSVLDWDPCGSWSPDGKALYYKIPPRELDEKRPDFTALIEKGADFMILRRELGTGEEREVHRGTPTADMQLSPDGTRFVYDRIDGKTRSWVLGILDLQSDKELELWRVPQAGPFGLTAPTWTPDGKYVLVGNDLKRGSELWRFPAAGGPGEKLHAFAESTERFVMHPGGTRMAFTQALVGSEVWVLENFLPAAKAAKQ